MALNDTHTREVQKKSTAAILAVTSSPVEDLANERRRATLNPLDVACVLYGGLDAVKERRLMAELLAADPKMKKSDRPFLSRAERIERGLQYSVRLRDIALENGLGRDKGQILQQLIDEPTGFDLHWGMFVPTVDSQGTEEQKQKWLYPAMMFQLLGTYAQTELGHGTFIRGLETTATYDKKNQNFVLHTPTLSGLKWWPGGLGKTATHAVVMARLFLDGRDYGPHAFVVQLRDLKTHNPLPGLEIGEIGPKMGFTAVDNGFLRFDHYVVPRDSMLMKHAQVTAEGKYVRPPIAKASYGTMVFVRATLVQGSFLKLSRAVTIAIRYSAVRRQTAPEGQTKELQILDYQNQQYELFPLLAASYALRYTGAYMEGVYKSFVDSEDFDSLPEVHATSAGLKALTTWITAEGTEVCRKCCGGHGFSMLSGLPQAFADNVAACTYEGDNNVMSLQTAKYLQKILQSAKQGEALGGNVNYVRDFGRISREKCGVTDWSGFLNLDLLLTVLRHRSLRIIMTADKSLSTARAQGESASEAWNNNVVELVRSSKAHCHYVILSSFVKGLSKIPQPLIKDLLSELASLYGLWVIERDLGDFLEDGYFSPSQSMWARKCLRYLLQKIRPNAVALVDSFDHSDYFIDSALGSYDGNVYQRLYDLAKTNPMNKSHQGPGYDTIVGPLLQSHL